MPWYLWLLWPSLVVAQAPIPVFFGRSDAVLSPAVDRAGKTVVFGAALGPDGTTHATADIYVIDSDGTGLHQLSHLATDSQQPPGASQVSMAADASRAAYTVQSTGRNEELHVVDIDTAADQIVVVDTQGCIQPLIGCVNCFFPCVYGPHISPDGSKVLYGVRREQPLYIVNASGSSTTHLPIFSANLADAPQRIITSSGQFVFTSNAIIMRPSPGPEPGSTVGPVGLGPATDVYLANLDGTNVRQVTHFSAGVFATNAVVSADGSTIAFVGNRDPDLGGPSQISYIYVIQSDGSGLRTLTTGSDPPTAPSISADGRLVAYGQGGQVFLIHSDGTSRKVLTSFQTSWAQVPVISDDGSRILFTLGPQNNGGRGAIYAVSSDGTNLHAVFAPRALNLNGVTGLISFSAPSPGSLISAFGMNLMPDGLSVATRFPLPQALAGVSLRVNGQSLPLVSITSWQVTAQLPPDFPPGPAAFQLRFADGTMPAPANTEVQSTAPAIFFSVSTPESPPGTIAPTICQAALVHGNSGMFADSDHPAAVGEAVEIFGTGLGPTDPFVPAGEASPASPAASALAPLQVLIGGRQATLLFAGLAPGFAGVYQVNAVVPAGLTPGRKSVTWRMGQKQSSGCGTIAVQ